VHKGVSEPRSFSLREVETDASIAFRGSDSLLERRLEFTLNLPNPDEEPYDTQHPPSAVTAHCLFVYSADDQKDQPCTSRSLDSAARSDLPVFSVYWQHRLVPQTEIIHFPHLPIARTLLQCETNNISIYWRERLKGYIFFSASWKKISNNKLRFTVNPNLSEWMQRQDVKTLTSNSARSTLGDRIKR
jgi:hypothetical protein